MPRLRAILAWALCVAVFPASAGTAVVFTDGRSMRVESVEQVDGAAHLYLEGGGVLAVPAERIATIEREPDRLSPSRDGAKNGLANVEWPIDESAWRDAAGPFAELIELTSERHAVDPALLTAMAEVESAFDPRAVSPKGAVGLLQLMPATADRFGVADAYDAAQNLEGGARYMSWLLERYEGRTELALAGYNAGEGAVDRHRGVPPYGETRRYVRRVMDGAARLADLAP